jgi:hypothetical protein
VGFVVVDNFQHSQRPKVGTVHTGFNTKVKLGVMMSAVELKGEAACEGLSMELTISVHDLRPTDLLTYCVGPNGGKLPVDDDEVLKQRRWVHIINFMFALKVPGVQQVPVGVHAPLSP